MKALKKFALVTVMLCLISGVSYTPVLAQHAKSRKHMSRSLGTKKKSTTGKNKKGKGKPVFVPTAPDGNPLNEDNQNKWRPGEICILCENNPGLCSYCNGSGKSMLVTTEGTKYIVCEKCSGTGICPTCKGKTAKAP